MNNTCFYITHTLSCVSFIKYFIAVTHEGQFSSPALALLLGIVTLSLSFQQAKKGLLTLTVRTRLTAPPALGSHLSPPLCRSLSSSTCVAKDSSLFALESPASPASTAKPNYRVMVEVSLKKGRIAAHWRLCQHCPASYHTSIAGRVSGFPVGISPGGAACSQPADPMAVAGLG